MSLSSRKKRTESRVEPTGNRQNRQKQRKTFTLSYEAVALLDELSASSKSASSVLDELLLSLRRERERQEMEERMGRYYDQRSEEEGREATLWGDFATREFVAAELLRLRSK